MSYTRLLSSVDRTTGHTPPASSPLAARPRSERSRVYGTSGLGAVTDVTDDWGSALGVFRLSTPDPNSPTGWAFCFTLPIKAPGPAPATLALAVAQGMLVAGYTTQVFGVLTSTSPEGFVRCEVVFQIADGTFAGDIGKINEAVNKVIHETTGISGIGATAMLKLDGDEGRAFSNAGGLGTMTVVSGGTVSLTKAAATPHPRQVLVGTLAALDQATPGSLQASGRGSLLASPVLWVGGAIALAYYFFGN